MVSSSRVLEAEKGRGAEKELRVGSNFCQNANSLEIGRNLTRFRGSILHLCYVRWPYLTVLADFSSFFSTYFMTPVFAWSAPWRRGWLSGVVAFNVCWMLQKAWPYVHLTYYYTARIRATAYQERCSNIVRRSAEDPGSARATTSSGNTENGLLFTVNRFLYCRSPKSARNVTAKRLCLYGGCPSGIAST
ncbi:hypothetical protein COLO4_01903 [Corchorus olitorius]|uniref:Uncharacterized protein n=1 Tax=Corchorus olitorius TaxID=93759 RepID=A0A1R3L201_9ROSI|nr:hypothetical protein COLO4_01903 [Corchorus olitorius]